MKCLHDGHGLPVREEYGSDRKLRVRLVYVHDLRVEITEETRRRTCCLGIPKSIQGDPWSLCEANAVACRVRDTDGNEGAPMLLVAFALGRKHRDVVLSFAESLA